MKTLKNFFPLSRRFKMLRCIVLLVALTGVLLGAVWSCENNSEYSVNDAEENSGNTPNPFTPTLVRPLAAFDNQGQYFVRLYPTKAEDVESMVAGDLVYKKFNGDEKSIETNVLTADFALNGRVKVIWKATGETAIYRDDSLVLQLQKVSFPRLSHDGNYVVYTLPIIDEEESSDDQGIRLLDISTRETKMLTSSTGDFSPTWLNDEWVLFGSSRTDIAALWLVSAKSLETKQLTNLGIDHVGEGFTPLPSEYPKVTTTGRTTLVKYLSDDTKVELVVDLSNGTVVSTKIDGIKK